MKILGLVPARGGSKGIPDKNMKKLGGKELIRYAIEVGLDSDKIDKLIVSTDDESIARVSRDAGAEVPFLRPAELAADDSPTIDAVIHALEFLRRKSVTFDAVCLLQPTSPLRTVHDLNRAIELFKNSNADSLISVREVPHHYNPHWVFEPIPNTSFLKIATGDREIIPRRQELPKAYHRDGAIYITKCQVIEHQRSLFGEKIAYFLNTQTPSINLDTPEDWKNAERFLSQ